VYIGDSMTDVPPLISADAGILVGGNSLVRQVAAVAGALQQSCASSVRFGCWLLHLVTLKSGALGKLVPVVLPLFMARLSAAILCPCRSVQHCLLI
jgi:hypothetical protein